MLRFVQRNAKMKYRNASNFSGVRPGTAQIPPLRPSTDSYSTVEMLRTALLSIQTLCDSVHALRSNQQRLELRLTQLELHLGSLGAMTHLIHPFQQSSGSFQPPPPHQFTPSPFVSPHLNTGNGHVMNGSDMMP